jgi:hypothetical protein
MQEDLFQYLGAILSAATPASRSTGNDTVTRRAERPDILLQFQHGFFADLKSKLN